MAKNVPKYPGSIGIDPNSVPANFGWFLNVTSVTFRACLIGLEEIPQKCNEVRRGTFLADTDPESMLVVRYSEYTHL